MKAYSEVCYTGEIVDWQKSFDGGEPFDEAYLNVQRTLTLCPVS